MKPGKTWIVVADGARARIFVNNGPGRGLTEVPERAREIDLKSSGQIDADRPGRTFDSAGEGRHAMEPPTDSKRHAKRSFANGVASMLDEAYRAKAFDRFILVAPPSALGDLRDAMTNGTRSALYGELAKDLTQLDERALATHLSDILVV